MSPSALTLLGHVRRRIRSVGELLLLVRVALVMALLPVLARLETRRMLRWLERIGAFVRTGLHADTVDIVRMVRSCGGVHVWAFQDNCVAQSLTLFTLLHSPERPLEVVFGVELLGSEHGAPRLGRRHVWLEHHGAAVYERESLDLTTYAVQSRHSGGTETDADGSARLMRVLGLSGFASALGSVASVARTKLVAVVLGPAGVAVSGQLSQALLALNWLATFGTGAGTTRFVAEALAADDDAAAGRVVRSAGVLLVGVALVLGAAGVLFAEPLSTWLFGTRGAARWTLWLAASVPAAALLSLSTAVLRGASQANRLAVAQAIGAVASVAAAFAFVRGSSVDALAPLALVVTATQAVATTTAAWPLLRRLLTASSGLDMARGYQVAAYGLINVVMGLATAAAALFIGRSYLAAGQPVTAGHIAALAWFSEPLAGALVSGFHASTFPAYCAATPTEAPGVLSRSVRAYVLLAAPLLAVGVLVARPALRLLFTPAFAALAALLAWQLVATYVRTVNVLLGLPLLARGRVVPLTLLHLAWAVSIARGATYQLGGAATYVQALLVGGLVQTAGLLLLLWLFRLAPRARDLAWLCAGAALLILVIVL